MKNHLRLSLSSIIFILIVLLSSCGDSDNAVSGNGSAVTNSSSGLSLSSSEPGQSSTASTSSTTQVSSAIDNSSSSSELLSSADLSSSSAASVETDSTFTDSRDGTLYKKVTIGNQVWMAENLKYETATSECYDNSPSNCASYGRLYSQSDALGGLSTTDAVPSGRQGVCPDGWHLPSLAEWDSLASFIASETSGAEYIPSTVSASSSVWSLVGKKLKSTLGWNSGEEGTDDYGFSALPGGMQYNTGISENMGFLARWWTTSEFRGFNGYHITLNNTSDDFNISAWDPSFYFSVRCVQD